MTGRRFFWLGVAVFAATLVVSAFVLPVDDVPLHWDAAGAPDRVGTRDQALGEMLVVGVALGGLMLALALLVHRLPWELVNIPDKDLWTPPENQRVARRRLQDDVYHCGAWTMLLLAGVVVFTAVAARRDVGFWPWGMAVVAAFLVGLAVTLSLRMRFYRRLPDEQ